MHPRRARAALKPVTPALANAISTCRRCPLCPARPEAFGRSVTRRAARLERPREETGRRGQRLAESRSLTRFTWRPAGVDGFFFLSCRRRPPFLRPLLPTSNATECFGPCRSCTMAAGTTWCVNCLDPA
eukprot:scaffold268_cov236-Pinguiococcus_pyrenoidosus.AAC.1